MAKIALLVGVSEYEPGLNPLPAAVKDVEAVRRVLEASDLGAFAEVKTLTNVDSQVMQYEIETLFSSRSKEDLVLLFFSGHGIKDDSGRLYFASRNTRKNPKNELIRSTAVPASFIHEVMNGSRAKRQAIILDCCFSGAFDPSLIARDDSSVNLQGELGAEGRVVLTSSSSTQYSFEQQGSDLSIYTRYLVEGIETGAGDQNNDGNISILELHNYASSKVQETAPSMTPKIIVFKDKGFEIVLSKAKVTDPKLKYRKEAQSYANRGTITPIGRLILDRQRIELNLSLEEAFAIENEVLRPYQKRLENLEQYKAVLLAAIGQKYSFDENIQNELNVLQQMLGLRDEDTQPIKDEIIAQLALEKIETEQSITVNARDVGSLRVCAPILYLRILGTSYAYEVPSTLDRISIGRQRRKPDSLENEGNDVVIRVPESDQQSLKISRKHLEISQIRLKYFVLDKSGGRTKLNGNVLKEGELHEIRPHDTLQISDVLELEVLIQDKLETLTLDKVIEIYKPDQSKDKLIVEASIGDVVTLNEESISDMATINASGN